MASNTGGQFLFTAGKFLVNLGLNPGTTTPTPIKGDLNIEVFTSPTVSSLPTLDTGFQQGVIDHNGTIDTTNLLTGKELTLFGGAYQVTDIANSGHSPALIQLGTGNQTVIGAPGDTIIGGSGNQEINASIEVTSPGTAGVAPTGGEVIIGGSGNLTIFGGSGDTITGGSAGTTYIDGSAGNMHIAIGSGAADTIFGSGASGFADTVTGGTGNAVIENLGAGDAIDLSGGTGNDTINALVRFTGPNPGDTVAPGGVSITLGGGADVVFGGTGDTITLGGPGNQYVDGSAGGLTVGGGTVGGGIATVFGSDNSGNPDLITGGAANLDVQGLGAGDTVDLSAGTGNATINPLLDSVSGVDIILGAGSAVVFGFTGDTITLGSGGQYVDARAGGMSVQGGPGIATVIGSSVGGAASGDLISGAFGSLDYNLGENPTTSIVGGGDTIDLSTSTGTATINAFSNSLGVAQLGVNDHIIGSTGSDSVFGGDGDLIAIAANTTVGGTHRWSHGDTALGSTIGSVGFGTDDSPGGLLGGTLYNTTKGTFTTLAGGSHANVTIGGDTSSGLGDFQAGQDFLFYQGETATKNSKIVATAQAIDFGPNKVASSQIALPDGTVMTIVGITPTELNTLNAGGLLFKAATA